MILHYRKLFRMALLLRTLWLGLIVLAAAPLHAAPGAHGPDGEHLTTETEHYSALSPRFETFSEQFELVGELRPQQLVLHLHDYQTNTPVVNAAIELEVANLSASARFVADEQHYLLDDATVLAILQQEGRHEIILTVITDTAADLLTASLQYSDDHDEAHDNNYSVTAHQHFHFPWWSTLILLAVFITGVLVGRKRAAK